MPIKLLHVLADGAASSWLRSSRGSGDHDAHGGGCRRPV